MDYVKQLAELVVKLTQKIKQQKQQIAELEAAQDSDELYYVKYQNVKKEKLDLEEKVAKLEMTIQMNNVELEKRNKLLLQYGVKA